MVQAIEQTGNNIAELAKFCYELTHYGDEAYFEYLPDLNGIAITVYKGNSYTEKDNKPVFACLFNLTLKGLKLDDDYLSVDKVKLLIAKSLGNFH